MLVYGVYGSVIDQATLMGNGLWIPFDVWKEIYMVFALILEGGPVDIFRWTSPPWFFDKVNTEQLGRSLGNRPGQKK